MSNYTKATNFATKDTLPTGDANKIVKGTEIDNEFNAISGAISSKADIASPTFTGTPAAPTAIAGTNTTQIATTAFALANGVPSGVILLWSGSVASIPTGWVLCNGSSGTPDLRNRFIVGAGSTYAVAATGGSANATLVEHRHSINFNTSEASQGHAHSYASSPGVGQGAAGSPNSIQQSAGSGTTSVAGADHVHLVNGVTAFEGSSATNANLPPYYALAYIMKI